MSLLVQFQRLRTSAPLAKTKQIVKGNSEKQQVNQIASPMDITTLIDQSKNCDSVLSTFLEKLVKHKATISQNDDGGYHFSVVGEPFKNLPAITIKIKPHANWPFARGLDEYDILVSEVGEDA